MPRGRGGVTLQCHADSDQKGQEHGLHNHHEERSVLIRIHKECVGLCQPSSKCGRPSFARQEAFLVLTLVKPSINQSIYWDCLWFILSTSCHCFRLPSRVEFQVFIKVFLGLLSPSQPTANCMNGSDCLSLILSLTHRLLRTLPRDQSVPRSFPHPLDIRLRLLRTSHFELPPPTNLC